ncbi:MAG: hypothetical protein Q9212_001267 [Teloschistes hypoglaucus]
MSTQQPANFPSAASVSPPQNRRVSNLIQGTGYSIPANSQRSTSTGIIMSSHRQHAYSDPSPTGNLASHGQTFPQLQAINMKPVHWDHYMYDSSFASLDPTASPTTVTPIDLFLNTPSTFQPTPESDNFDSPGAIYSNDTSPFFTVQESPADYSLNYDAGVAPKNMFPELPGTNVQAPSTEPATIDNTQLPHVNSAAAMSRKASGQSPDKSPRGSRLLLSSGIKKPKPKKRQGKLKEMIVSAADPASEKRCRNTLAARNSRARKAQRMEALEVQSAKWKRRCFESGWQGDDDDEVEVE